MRAAPGRTLRSMASFIAGGMAPLALVGAYNLGTTGNVFTFGYQVHNASMHVMGFHAGGTYPHTVGAALDHLTATILSAWWQVGGWFIGSGVPEMPFALAGGITPSATIAPLLT